MDVRVVDHPLALARLSTMRDARTGSAGFRAALQELTLMLIYEATRDAEVAEALDLLRRGDRAAFVERFAEIGDWFGPYAERFLAESRTLLAHADASR